jgi:hypothetical protein
MSTKNFGLLAFILLTSVLFILLAFNTVTLFAAAPPTIDNYPQNAILENIQGGTFTLHHTFTYKQAASGFYLISVYWEYVNPNTGLPDNNYNFTLDNYRAYDNSGNWVECTIIFDSDNGSLHSQVFGNTVGDTNNYTFNVDIRYSLKGPDGTLHIVTDNHPFHYTNIDLRETNIVDAYPDDVTVKVLTRGADVSISPGSQSGLPGAVINYTVTVKNTGTFGRDNYNLTVGDNSGWGDNIWLDNYRLENTPQGENRTTTLRVRIPTNATGFTDDNIWVKATSQGDNTKSDNDNCIAHVTIVRGVQVTISPSPPAYLENENGGTLTYAVTVKNLGNVQENFKLENGDNAGWTLSLDNTWLLIPKSENRTTKMTVNIPPNARGCTWDNIWVKATSKDDAAVFDNKSCLAHVRVIHGVDVSISPDYQENLPGGNLEYTVTVANTGNAEDTYDLRASDDLSWSRSVSPTPLTVPSLENRTATLSVTVPPGVIGYRNDNITVTATSRIDNTVSDSASCIAHRTGVVFELENLYAVTLDLDAYFSEGENLVAKFYTYGGGSYQNQTVVCSENIPGHVTLLENVSRPGNGPIQRVKLVVVDNANNELGTIKIFETSRTVLVARIGRINALWPFASEAQKTPYVSELGSINGTWPFSPET